MWRGDRPMPQNVDLKIVVNKQKRNANTERVSYLCGFSGAKTRQKIDY